MSWNNWLDELRDLAKVDGLEISEIEEDLFAPFYDEGYTPSETWMREREEMIDLVG